MVDCSTETTHGWEMHALFPDVSLLWKKIVLHFRSCMILLISNWHIAIYVLGQSHNISHCICNCVSMFVCHMLKVSKFGPCLQCIRRVPLGKSVLLCVVRSRKEVTAIYSDVIMCITYTIKVWKMQDRHPGSCQRMLQTVRSFSFWASTFTTEPHNT